MKSKNFDLVLFSSLFTGLYVISNVIAVRQVEVFGMLVTSSFIVYPLTFVISNIINERLGIKESRKAIFSGLITVFLIMALLCVAYYLPGTKGDTEDAYKLIFSNNVLVYLSSIIAFIVSQVINFTVYNGLKTNMAVKYLISSSLAVFVDALLFKSMMVYLGVVNGEIFTEVLSHVLFGVLTVLVATPLFFVFCFKANKKAN